MLYTQCISVEGFERMYTSPVAWVDAGNRMSEWIEEDRAPVDTEFLRQAATPPSTYPIESRPGRTDDGYQTISAKEMVGRFVVF